MRPGRVQFDRIGQTSRVRRTERRRRRRLVRNADGRAAGAMECCCSAVWPPCDSRLSSQAFASAYALRAPEAVNKKHTAATAALPAARSALCSSEPLRRRAATRLTRVTTYSRPDPADHSLQPTPSTCCAVRSPHQRTSRSLAHHFSAQSSPLHTVAAMHLMYCDKCKKYTLKVSAPHCHLASRHTARAMPSVSSRSATAQPSPSRLAPPLTAPSRRLSPLTAPRLCVRVCVCASRRRASAVLSLAPPTPPASLPTTSSAASASRSRSDSTYCRRS